ncbi:MAG TPA: hypothetical protein VM241_05785 [Candidatus Thermoplasmatota archaeon]|nr:hypothetical protein [Candidatus Thermoplasmatota archaeon]
MTSLRLAALFAVTALAVSGCATPAATTTTSQPVLHTPKAMVNTTILSVDFIANSATESTAALKVPNGAANGTRLWVWVEADQGAWQTFVLSGLPEKCSKLTTYSGLMLSGDVDNGSGGATCLVPPGDYTLHFQVKVGAVKGHLSVKAEVPA